MPPLAGALGKRSGSAHGAPSAGPESGDTPRSKEEARMSPLTHSHRARRIAALVGVATLGSAAAYGVGTQAGNGVAGAKTSTTSSAPAQRGPSTSDLQTLADKLGVSVDKLKAAFDATRPAKPKARPSGTRLPPPRPRRPGGAPDRARPPSTAAARRSPKPGPNPPPRAPRPPSRTPR